MAAAPARVRPRECALDIPEAQVATDFFGGQYPWHARILFEKFAESRWVGCSPDGEVQVVDLRDHRVIPLVRDAEVPQRIRGQCYLFDAESLTVAGLRRIARRYEVSTSGHREHLENRVTIECDARDARNCQCAFSVAGGNHWET